jgi:hypothetical protein
VIYNGSNLEFEGFKIEVSFNPCRSTALILLRLRLRLSKNPKNNDFGAFGVLCKRRSKSETVKRSVEKCDTLN